MFTQARACLAIRIIAITVCGLQVARAADATTQPAHPAGRPKRVDTWPAFREKTLAALNSGDPEKVATALQELHETAKTLWPHRERALQLLMQAKFYPDAAQLATDLILVDPGMTDFIGTAQRYRMQALIAQKKYEEALSAARSYYDIAHLIDSADAIDQVALCLALGKPDDPTIAKRFKQQQVAWAGVDAASQPSTDSLGPPVLAGIATDSKPFEGIADTVELVEYKQFVTKGNLLLLTGKAKEAHAIFERAQGIAPEKNEAEAVENIARAIRAESGCVGPANAYVLKMRAEQH